MQQIIAGGQSATNNERASPRTGPRRLGVLTAVLLILSSLAPGYPALAQPLPQDTDPSQVTSITVSTGGPIDICVGNSHGFTVSVAGSARVIRNGRPVQVQRRISGVRVNAVVMNASLGTFTPTTQTTALRRGQSSLDPFSHATFLFTAQKPGTTSLYFEVPGSTQRTSPVRVRIEDCEPKLLVLLDAEIEGARYHGALGPVTLQVGDDGSLSGTGPLQWTETARDPECSAVWSVPGLLATQATITGSMSDTSIDVTVAFQPYSHGVCGVCEGSSVCIDGGDDFGEISVSLPASGGAIMMQSAGYFTVILERRAPEAAVSAVPDGGRAVASARLNPAGQGGVQ